MQMINNDAISDIPTIVAFMQQGTARSLNLLRTIARTVTALRTTTNEARGFVYLVDELTRSLAQAEGVIVPEEVLPTFEQLQDDLAAFYALMREKQSAARSAAELRNDDGVCEAYGEALDSIHEFHECLETLRWMIMEHNVEQEVSSGTPLTSAEEIESYLASL